MKTTMSQCTFWCSVLSDRPGEVPQWPSHVQGSQCTFWCSVLSDPDIRLPAPGRHCGVSMHLLVLSAFRHESTLRLGNLQVSQCTFWCSVLSDAEAGVTYAHEDSVSMHLLVLSAFRRMPIGWRPTHGRVSMHLLVLSAFRLAVRDRKVPRVRRVSMHLLVLSAFRLMLVQDTARVWGLNAPFGAQCFPTGGADRVRYENGSLNAPFGAQCFPTGMSPSTTRRGRGLNAPFGAQCFPTRHSIWRPNDSRTVSMHLLVLSAFRLYRLNVKMNEIMSQCTFWCSVLSDFESGVTVWRHATGLNAPFGAQCFPTVSWLPNGTVEVLCLNAPFGAQCFPTPCGPAMYVQSRESQCTFWCSVLSDPSSWRLARLKSASQCTFWCSVLSDRKARRNRRPRRVSMHLLVLSAFRLRLQKAASQRRFPGRKRRRPGKHQIESARTAPIKPHNPRKPPQIDPAPPTSPTHRYATGFQRTYTKRSEPRDSATVNTATKASVDYPSRRRDGPFSANRRFANRRFPVPVALPPAATSRSAVFRQPPHSGSAAGRSGAATVDKGRTEAGKNGQGQNRSRQKRTGWNRSQQTG